MILLTKKKLEMNLRQSKDYFKIYILFRLDEEGADDNTKN